MAANPEKAKPEAARPEAARADGAATAPPRPEAPPIAEKPKAAAVKPQPSSAAPAATPQAANAEAAAKPAPPEKKHEAKPLKPETPAPGALVVEESVEIAAPPEKVWKVFTDEQNWTRWNPVIRRVRSLRGTPWTLGWEFELVLKNRPLPPLKVRPIVLEVSVPSLVRWFGTAPGLSVMHWFLFEKSETGARATCYEEFTGMLTPLLRPFRGPAARMIRRWLLALKAECEKAAPASTGAKLPLAGAKSES